MHGSYGKYVPVLLLSLLLTTATGCDTLREEFSFLPGIGGPAAYPPDLPTPKRRVNSLRELARQAAAPGGHQDVAITSALIGAMRDEDDSIVLAEKVRILGEYPSIVADAELEVALKDDDKEVRQAACEAWGRRGDATAAALLRGMLDGDRSMDVRLTAARELGKIRDPEAVAALATALEDSDPAMQYQAVLSLEKSTGENLGANVQRWRDYVRHESPAPANPVEVAGRPW